MTVYVLKLQFFHVLNFWVPERARVIYHDKKQLYVLNFEYAKPGTLRDKRCTKYRELNFPFIRIGVKYGQNTEYWIGPKQI